MGKQINIEKILFPNSGKLIIKDECITAQIVDIELDPIECSFHNDDCVNIDTKGYTYITLSIENLEQLIRLTYKAQEKYEEMFENEINE